MTAHRWRRRCCRRGQDDRTFRPIIVGMANADPYVEHAEAIRALGQHFGIALERSRCYPYRRD